MALQVTNLSRQGTDKWILRDVSFEVGRGEVLGVYGASGSGKSTLLRAIAGQDKIHGGSVSFNGNDLTSKPAKQRGFEVPDLTHLNEDGGFFKRKNVPASVSHKRVEAVLASLHDARDVLLLDDPFCGIDRATRRDIYKKLRETVEQNGLCIVLTSSDYDDICEVCDRVAILAATEIKQIGTPHDVYEHPATAAIAAIVGRNNLFLARRLTSNKVELPEFLTLEGEHRIFGQKTEKNSLGAINQNVTLAVRPEHISMSFGASFPEDNLLKAVITGIKYFGATTIVDLDCNGLHLEAMVLRLVGLNIGDECMVGLPPDRILVLKD